MLQTLEKLQFNHRFTKILYEIKALNTQLMQAVQSMENQQILVIFSSYGYPFLFGLTLPQQSQQAFLVQQQQQQQQKF